MAEIVGDGRPWTVLMISLRRPVDHAQQRADRELAADLEPPAELFPCTAVHTDLAPLAAFPASDEHRAAAAVKVALLEGERFADPLPRASQSYSSRAVATTGRAGGYRTRALMSALGRPLLALGTD